jgi:hypothetical protein
MCCGLWSRPLRRHQDGIRSDLQSEPFRRH